MSQRQWIHVHLGKRQMGKKIKPHTAKPGVIGKRLSDFLPAKSEKNMFHTQSTP